ncbi:glycine-rich domain-containing protein [Pararhizobium sp.]|uniref:glycine-rich domain-containing protein n=1 Tax=Pararhizobium sp. TaxID=1977563 RepID=UPI003D0B1713
MMVPNVAKIANGGPGASAGSLVRKRILTVDGGKPFLRIAESTTILPHPDNWLNLLQAEYDGPLTLTKGIVEAEVVLIGGGGGGALRPYAEPGRAYGGFGGGVYKFKSLLSEMTPTFYIFVGSGGPGGTVPSGGSDGSANAGSATQFYLYTESNYNDPAALGGYGGTIDDATMREAWFDMCSFGDCRMPDPTLRNYGGTFGNQNGPGPGGVAVTDDDGQFYFSAGGFAYSADPMLTTEPGYDPGAAGGVGNPAQFGSCGAGGAPTVNNEFYPPDGGAGGFPGAGGGASFTNTGVGGSGADGCVDIQFSIWELA